MALTQNVELTDNFGEKISFANAYIRVENLTGTKLSIAAKVSTYKSKDADFLGYQFVNFTPDMNGGNFIAQAYEYLKALPEFTQAKDC
jgi:hypothetical protein